VPEGHRLADAADDAAERRWVSYWRTNPIAAWTNATRQRRAWFRLDDDRFVLTLAIAPTWREAFIELVRELVDYRLVRYLRRSSVAAEGFTCRVASNQRGPILKLPSRTSTPLPEGEIDVRMADGAVWQFRFTQDVCSVARPVGQSRNQLPDLLRRWFGPRAGQPGTAFDVRFVASPDGLWVEPVDGAIAPLAPLREVVVYPELSAAAELAGSVAERGAAGVWLPVDRAEPDQFAVRMSGTSMDGGSTPLRDGDWALFRVARDAPAASVANRVVLGQVGGDAGPSWHIKRLIPEGRGWRLASDNPDGLSFVAGDQQMNVIGQLEVVVHPEDLAPPVGTVLTEEELPLRFGLGSLEPRTGVWGGHRFLVVDQPGALVAPDRLRAEGPRHSAETLYALAASDGGFRYLGVGRWQSEESAWAIPEVDFATWRAFGEGRSASRALPPGALARAPAAVDGLLGLPEAERVLAQRDGRARILGRAQRGGLRIALGQGERTVSLTDIGWVALAADDVASQGGVLDEARVNRLRYLEGTPKGSTRWVDTGWALAAWAGGARLAAAASIEGAAHRPLRDDGTEVDATFRVERVDDTVTVVVEARGGTRGTSDAVNTQYAEGLRVLLARLKEGGHSLADATLDTRATAELTLEERRLDVGEPWPLVIDDPQDLQRRLSKAQERIGKPKGTKGGNSTRRIRLWLTGDPDPIALVRALVGQG
jgi:hypothetical protein